MALWALENRNRYFPVLLQSD